MATKNLSRTVIEGGRRGWSKYERRHFTRQDRVAARRFIYCLKHDLDLWNEQVLPLRKKAYKEFNDRLGPCYRWLHSRVGKNWNETHAILFQKFDTQTTAGRHIVFSHLLKAVQSVDDRHHPIISEYLIDTEGTLIYRPRRKRYRHERILKSYEPDVSKWLNARRIIQHGNILFWLVPVVTIIKISDSPFIMRRTSFPQDKRFSSEDEAYFYSLSFKARKELLEMRLRE